MSVVPDWCSTRSSYLGSTLYQPVFSSTVYADDEYVTAEHYRRASEAVRAAAVATTRASSVSDYSPLQPPAHPPVTQKGTSVLKELSNSISGYIREHRDMLFTVVFVLLLDEYVFDGAFRDRLKSVIGGMLKKFESKTGVDLNGDGVVA